MKRLVITVLVLAAVLVGADFAAAAAAEYQVSQRLQDELDVPEDPAVRIHGFPFLTQAISGHYDRIEVSARGLDVGPLHNVAIEATMWDVHAPLGQVLTGDLSDVRIDRVQGRVRIDETDLGQVIGLDDLQIEPTTGRAARQALAAPGVPGSGQDRAAARMSATTDVGGQRVEVIVIALLELVDGTVRVSPVDVRLDVDEFGVFGLPDALRDLVLSRFAVRIDPGKLPFTVVPTDVTVRPGSIVVVGTASDVTLGQAHLSRK